MARPREGVRYARWFWPAFAWPGLLWLILLFLVPFYAVLAVAFGQVDPILRTPLPVWNPLLWNTDSIEFALTEVLRGSFQIVFLRTLLYVAAAVVLSLLVGYPVAYYISRHGGRFKTVLLVLLIAPFWISYLMRMLAWVNLLQDNGYVNRSLMFLQVIDVPRHWLEGQSITVVLGLVYGYIPFLILPLYAALDRIDQSLLEAARDLGGSRWHVFRRVTLPLSKQGILAGSAIIMLPMFGDYYTADLLSGSPKTTMIGNLINFFIHSPGGSTRGAALVFLLSVMVSALMLYYLLTVARASREAGR
jgi:ABC-type spermidine/putrescine transport system permease subunit I